LPWDRFYCRSPALFYPGGTARSSVFIEISAARLEKCDSPDFLIATADELEQSLMPPVALCKDNFTRVPQNFKVTSIRPYSWLPFLTGISGFTSAAVPTESRSFGYHDR